jgi:hypothetical protein
VVNNKKIVNASAILSLKLFLSLGLVGELVQQKWGFKDCQVKFENYLIIRTDIEYP